MREWAGGETGTGVADGAHGAASAGGAEGAPFGEYCPYTKAAEYLGDRWVLLIVRGLAVFGPQGFNALAAALPGVSRSVLARRLRALEALGLIARGAAGRGHPAPYRLAPAGEQLVPTLLALHRWAERWVPEDSALAGATRPSSPGGWRSASTPGPCPPARWSSPSTSAARARSGSGSSWSAALRRRAASRTPGWPRSGTSTSRPTGRPWTRSRGAAAPGAPPSPTARCSSTASRRSCGRCRTGSGRRVPAPAAARPVARPVAPPPDRAEGITRWRERMQQNPL